MRSSYAVQVVLDRYPGLRPKEVESMLRYRTFVSVPKRYMYCEVPKAACTAMKWLLHGLENGPMPLKWSLGETRRDMFVHSRQNVPLPSLVDLDDQTQRYILESPDVLRLTIVRNPYTRLVSTWRNKVLPCEPGFDPIYVSVKGQAPGPDCKPFVSLQEFLDYLDRDGNLDASAHWAPQVDHMFFGAFSYSLVGKMEYLSDALRRFQQHLGLAEPLRLSRKNASSPLGNITYDAGVAGAISRLYRRDFETFDYDPAVWPLQDESPKAAISEATYRDEIIERNIIIAHLAAECARLEHLERRSTRWRRRMARVISKFRN